MKDNEDNAHDGCPEPLIGDGVTPGIVRIGHTVRRPARPFSATIQAYLAHLHAVGFTGAPIPMGFDQDGREVLSYVPGEVPREPLPSEAATDQVLIALAQLIRHLHEASQSWIPPADAVWGGLPGNATTPRIDHPAELVSHRDYCPGNVVFCEGRPVALIDFDLARPTTRLYDIANALYWWAPLWDPIDRAPAFVQANIPERVALFANAYGMSTSQRRDLVPLAERMIRRFHASARRAAEVDPVFRRLWEQSGQRLPRAEQWIATEGPNITAQLLLSGPEPSETYSPNSR